MVNGNLPDYAALSNSAIKKHFICTLSKVNLKQTDATAKNQISIQKDS